MSAPAQTAAVAAYRTRRAALAQARQARLPSGVMIYKGAHHTAAAYPELVSWLEFEKASNKRPRTLEVYERYCAHLLIKHPDTPFDRFTDQELLPQLTDTPPRSRHVHKAAFNRWFRWGLKTRRLTVNPVDFLPDIRYRPNRNITVFTPAETSALRNLPFPDGQLMTVLLETGMRNQEARYLTVRRVDFRQQEILVREGVKGGDAKERIVPLTTAAAGALNELIAVEGLDPHDHFWCSHPGGGHRTTRATPTAASTFYRWWKDCLEEAGVAYRKPHTTRHTFATYWLERLDDGEVQDMLGHESIRTTRDIYQHRSIGRTGEKMRRLEAEETDAHSSSMRERVS